MKNLFLLALLVDINPVYLTLIIVGGVILVAAIIVIILLTRKNKKDYFNENDWLTALGGKENIKEVSAIGSRLSVNLTDKEIIDREKLKQLGVSSVLVMSNKVTLVIEGKAEQVAASIQKGL